MPPGQFRFTGEQWDSAGLEYLRARYYDPANGRFAAADTVQPNAPGTQGWNLYAYVANNPTASIDPTGHLAAGAISRAPTAGGATDSLAPYVDGAIAAGALAGLGLRIRDSLTLLALVLSGAWTLVEIWQAVDNDDPNDCIKTMGSAWTTAASEERDTWPMRRRLRPSPSQLQRGSLNMSENTGRFRMPPAQLGDIVAQSVGGAEHPSGMERTLISIGRPFTREEESGLWYCSYSVQKSSMHLASGTVAGVDSLQALILCAKVLQAEVARLSRAGSITVPEGFATDA